MNASFKCFQEVIGIDQAAPNIFRIAVKDADGTERLFILGSPILKSVDIQVGEELTHFSARSDSQSNYIGASPKLTLELVSYNSEIILDTSSTITPVFKEKELSISELLELVLEKQKKIHDS